MLAAQLGHRHTGLAFFQHRNDLAFCEPALLQGNLRLVEAPKFYRLMSTLRGSLPQEIEQLRRELARVKTERDILKKAVGYFAKDQT